MRSWPEPAVELRLGKIRGRLAQDLVGLAQLAHFPLEILDPPMRSARRIQRRKVSAVQPIFEAIEQIPSHSEPYSPRCSFIIRTARSRTSRENLLLFPVIMAPFPQESEPPAIPGRFNA